MLRQLVIFWVSCFLLISGAEAKTKLKAKNKVYIAPPLQASLVVDADTGKVLHSDKARDKIYPASITKLMTLYLAFEALDAKKISMNTMLSVSKRSQNMRPTKLGLIAGQKISMHDAILGTSIKSANDAAVAIAEGLCGTEERFAVAMNSKAAALVMHNTNFTNASGWHHPKQHSTAVDLAKLGLAIKRDFPQYYRLLGKTSFVFKGQTIHGHDQVLKNYDAAEAGKTGFHSHSGFSLLTGATKNGKRLVGVVTGCPTQHFRYKKMVALLDKHFEVSGPSLMETSVRSKSKKKQPIVRVASTYKIKKRSVSKTHRA